MPINGDKLRKLREDRGLYPQQIADYLGISRIGYLKYENGSTKHPRKIDELAKFFNVSIDYLLDNDVSSYHSFKCSPSEEEMVKKYRLLTPAGKKTVDTILALQLELSRPKLQIGTVG